MNIRQLPTLKRFDINRVFRMQRVSGVNVAIRECELPTYDRQLPTFSLKSQTPLLGIHRHRSGANRELATRASHIPINNQLYRV